VSDLVGEILLRLAKAAAAGALGLIVYLVVAATGHPASPELAILCWLAGAAFVLVIQESPI
jgi:peptidoglycan/LPS O-acetylase OafA/YrhL